MCPLLRSRRSLRWHDPASPGIYRHLLAQAGTEPPAALLVSCNPFDIAGAGATGMRTAWCKRQPDALFDPGDRGQIT